MVANKPRPVDASSRLEYQQSSSSARWAASRLVLFAMVTSLLAVPIPSCLLPACLEQLPVEALQNAFLAAGMLLYVVYYLRRQPSKRRGKRIDQDSISYTCQHPEPASPSARSSNSQTLRQAPAPTPTWVPPRHVTRPSVRQDSKQPVQPPSLDAKGFTEQVDELLAQIAPTDECERVVKGLAQTVKTLIRKHWPSATVIGIVSGDISRCTSFGVAVPEVDIIVKLRPQELAWPLQARLSRSGAATSRTDVRKLQKSAIRVCTDVLVSEGGFKFRRSAFRGKEPKVTLMAPRALGLAEQNIPIDFSVNAGIPLCNTGLLTELERLEPRAKALALLVRRWAKDRGICHAAKGHLPPFAWTLLTVYFLQVGAEKAPLLPALKKLKTPTSPSLPIWGSKDDMPSPLVSTGNESVGQLFSQFVEFYLEGFNWKDEAASVRLGQRSGPEPTLPRPSIRMPDSFGHGLLPDGGFQTTPAIEDPFTPHHNLAECLTADGFDRLTEELKRARMMMDSGASLTGLLSPWVPPDHRPNAIDGSDVEEDDEERSRSQGGSGSGSRSRCESGDLADPATSPPPGLELNDTGPLDATVLPPAEESAPPWKREKA